MSRGEWRLQHFSHAEKLQSIRTPPSFESFVAVMMFTFQRLKKSVVLSWLVAGFILSVSSIVFAEEATEAETIVQAIEDISSATESFVEKAQKSAEDASILVVNVKEVLYGTQKLTEELRESTESLSNTDQDEMVQAGGKLENAGKELVQIAYELEKSGQDIVNVVKKSAKLPPLPDLIRDLGLIIISATVMLLLFKWIRQPIILGYLLAGFIISPYFLTTDPTHPLYESYAWLNKYLWAIPDMISISDKENIHI